MTKLIGLGYRKGSGKDTVADILINHFGEDNMTRLPWAGTLKEACKIIFGWDDTHVYGDMKEEHDGYWGMTPRHALQQVATELFRNWMPDIWIKANVRKIMYERDHGRHVVISDVRFLNEIEVIKRMGGEVWLIDRPEVVNHDEHASETELDKFYEWDKIIVNDGTIDQLKTKVIDVLG